MAGTSGSSTPALYFIAILLLIVVIRVRRIITGTRISKARSIAFSAYYVAFAGFLIATSFLYGVPAYLAVLYLAIGAAGLVGANRAVKGSLYFWRAADGSIWAKGGIIIYIIYIAALIARVAIDLVYLPSALSFTTSVSAQAASPTVVEAQIITDCLLAFGSGLLTGRNLRLYTRYTAIERGALTVTETPENFA